MARPWGASGTSSRMTTEPKHPALSRIKQSDAEPVLMDRTQSSNPADSIAAEKICDAIDMRECASLQAG